MPDERLLYRSRPGWRNLFQEYRLYADRLELPCRTLWHTLRVPLEEIAAIGLEGPFDGALRWNLKLDLSDLFPHLFLIRRHGWIKTLTFTPDDPAAFLAAVTAAMQRRPPRPTAARPPSVRRS
jgi:hypothetical protein